MYMLFDGFLSLVVQAIPLAEAWNALIYRVGEHIHSNDCLY